jgi:alpha-D-ribose 1-methylphosphonate 5-triphosphate synthase subunit PhnH
MKAKDLRQVRPGFHDPALGSQIVFRTALRALSYPGRVQSMPAVTDLPLNGKAAAASLLLALVDSECAVWISPTLADTDAAAWLRFHTGCTWAKHFDSARFLWIAENDELPELASLALGSDDYPDQSATVVVEVASLDDDTTVDALKLSLEGPGIALTQGVTVTGLPGDFVTQWAINHQAFPRGVDLFLATSHEILGLPRSTRIHALQEA